MKNNNINYRRGSDKAKAAWFRYKRDTPELKGIRSASSFIAGWNAAMVSKDSKQEIGEQDDIRRTN